LTLNVEAKDIRNDLSLQQLHAQVCWWQDLLRVQLL
jgi:hypothetical protein